MDTTELDRRLALASRLLGWGESRVAAFREGYADARPDAGRLHRHAQDDGYAEAGLAPELLDSLAYREGRHARGMASFPTVDLGQEREGLVAEASAWAANGDSGVDPGDADWTFDPAASPGLLLSIMGREEWVEWFVAEHRDAVEDGRPGYGDLLVEDVKQAIVVLEAADGTVEIWDGWHRAGAVVAKGASSLPLLLGRERAPALRP